MNRDKRLQIPDGRSDPARFCRKWAQRRVARFSRRSRRTADQSSGLQGRNRGPPKVRVIDTPGFTSITKKCVATRGRGALGSRQAHPTFADTVAQASPPSCPALCRAFTSFFLFEQDVDGRDKPGHDDISTRARLRAPRRRVGKIAARNSLSERVSRAQRSMERSGMMRCRPGTAANTGVLGGPGSAVHRSAIARRRRA